MPKLPVLSTVQAAYLDTWNKRSELTALATPAVVILSVLTAILAWGPSSDARFAIALLVQFVGLVVLIAPFSVAWLRFLILEAQVVDPADALRWGQRQGRTLAAYVRITVFSVAALFLIEPFAQSQAPALILAGFAASIAFLVIYSRLLMQIPSIAMDRNATLSEVWQLTADNGFRLAGIVLLAVLPPLLASLIISGLLRGLAVTAGAAGTLTFSLISSIVLHTFQFATLAVMLAALARAFTTLTPKQVALPE